MACNGIAGINKHEAKTRPVGLGRGTLETGSAKQDLTEGGVVWVGGGSFGGWSPSTTIKEPVSAVPAADHVILVASATAWAKDGG